jgi:drug/metabolite transporter (DMT)-like permease
MGMPWPRDEADWLAVSSGFAFSFANVMVRKTPHVSMYTKASVSWLGVVTVAVLWILVVREPFPDVQLPVWSGAVLLGWLGFVVMTLTVIYGVSHMPLHRSAVILLFELVVGAISAMLLTDEQVQTQEWLGGALILVAAYLAAHAQVGEHRK